MIKSFENIIESIHSDNFELIDLSNNYFNQSGSLKIFDGFNSVFRDNDHLTKTGVSLSKEDLKYILLKIKNRK